MRNHQSLFRLTAAVAIGGLMFGQGFAPLAYAQDAPPAPADGAAPAPGPAPADATAAVDPPARVGRIAALTGTVSFHTVDQTDWQFASLNYPVTSGNSFWTEPKANAALGLGDVKLVLDQQTEADIDTLTDAKLEITEPQGALYLHVRALAPGSTATVTTPRGIVSVTAAGRYEVVAGDSEQPTRVVVIDGAASIAVGDGTLAVAPGQAASVVGSDQTSFQGSVGTATQDPFVVAELNKEKPAAPKPAQAVVATAAPAYVPPPVVQDMTGYESLEQVGQWQPSPQYGHVWFPPVQANYVPYRNGHWAYVAPWGWTWVDNAPWGFAPFHYGRWAQVDNRWGWVPVQPGIQIDVGVRPVYAPALVSFVGFGVGMAVGAAIGAALSGGGGGSVGWVPLAPNEPYRPAFQASPAYVRNVNINHVSNVTNITNITNNTTTINNYANASAATVVPAQTMTASAPVAPAVQHFTPQQFAAARPMVQAQAPVRPTLQTVGVTPTVAQQLKLAPVAPAAAVRPGAKPGVAMAQVAARKPAPGPAIAPTPQAIAAGAVVAKPPGAVTPPVAPAVVKPATPPLVAKPGTAPPAVAAKPEVAKPEVAKPEVAKPEVAKPEVAKPESAAVAPKPALPALVKPTKSPMAAASVAPAPKTHAAPLPPAKPAAIPAVAKPAVAPPPKPAAVAPTKPAVAAPPKPAAVAPPKPAVVAPPKPAAAKPAPAQVAKPAPKPEPKPEPKPAEKKCPPNEKTC